MPSARDLQVKKGDPITPAWRRLIDWVRGKAYIRVNAPGARTREFPGRGTQVICPAENAWPFYWRVSLGAETVRVEPGFVNGTQARIEEVYLDGRLVSDPNQVSPNGPPVLRVLNDGVDPDAERLTRVVVRVYTDPDLPGEAPEVVHVQKAAKNEQVLALLRWDASGSTITRVHQVAMHNLGYAEAEEGRAFDFFWAV